MIQRNQLKFFIAFFAGLGFSSCAGLKRTPESGYGGENAGAYVKIYKDSSPQADGPRSSLTELQILERKMDSRKEKEQYSKILPWLKTDGEKIEFLKISGLENRQNWIQQKKIWQRAQSPTQEYKELIEGQDIAIGMPMDFVKKSWGEPQSVESSGNPLFKNERWRYLRNISTPEGFKQERRHVYFEGGRVVGWETGIRFPLHIIGELFDRFIS